MLRGRRGVRSRQLSRFGTLAGTDEPHLSVWVEADWACVWVKAVGDLVDSTAGQLTDAIGEALMLGVRKMMVILTGVSAVDGAGLARLDEGCQAARERRVKVAVRAPRRSGRIGMDWLDWHLGVVGKRQGRSETTWDLLPLRGP